MIHEALRERPRLEALRLEMLKVIPCQRPDGDARAQLASMRLDDLMMVWANWTGRFVMPRPRHVHFLDDFWRSLKALHNRDKINALVTHIQEGVDLTKYLSPRVTKEGYSFRAHGGDKWACKDFALNAYGIHHLHLIPCKADGSRGGLSRDLLFVRFYREHAVLLFCGDHRSFDDGAVADVAGRWARREGMVLNGVLMGEERSVKERTLLARHGISTIAAVEGKAVMESVLSTDGSSLRMVRHADRISNALEQLDPMVDDRSWLRQQFAVGGVALPDQPSLRWHLRLGDLLLVEETSKAALLYIHGHN